MVTSVKFRHLIGDRLFLILTTNYNTTASNIFPRRNIKKYALSKYTKPSIFIIYSNKFPITKNITISRTMVII